MCTRGRITKIVKNPNFSNNGAEEMKFKFFDNGVDGEYNSDDFVKIS